MGNRVLLAALMGMLCVGMVFADEDPLPEEGDWMLEGGVWWEYIDGEWIWHCYADEPKKKKKDPPGKFIKKAIEFETGEDARKKGITATEIVIPESPAPPKRLLALEEFADEVDQKKVDYKGKYKIEGAKGDNNKYEASSMEEAYAKYVKRQTAKAAKGKGTNPAHFELPEVTIGLKSHSAGFATGYRRTTLDSGVSTIGGDRVKSEGFSETITVTCRRGDWVFHALVPIERERYRGDADVLDNTSVGLTLAPVYRLMKREVHGFDVNVGANAGYQHSWYDEESDLDKPLGTRWGVGGFNNPDLFSAGPMIGAACPVLAGDVALALSHQWTWDMNGDDLLAGDDRMAYTTAKLRVEQAVTESVYVAADTTWSTTNDVPSEWDDSVFDSALQVGWQGERWTIAGSIGRAWANDDLSETAYTLTAGLTW